jgi:Tetratricopeptide repeat
MMASWRRRGLGLLSLSVFLGTSPSVMAQVPDAKARAEAQKLYEDGAKDMEAEAYSRACPKFEAAFKILPDHIRTGLTLAECLDKLGQPAGALKVLEAVKALAEAKGDTKKLAEIETIMADVDSRVPRLTLSIPNDIATMPGFAVTRDAIPVPRGLWGTAIPLESGKHEIEATAVDRPTWQKEVELRVGDRVTTVVEPIWEKPKPTVIVVPGQEGPNRLRVAGIVGIGLGAAGLVTWGILGGIALAKHNAAQGHCNAQNMCDAAGFTQRTDAISLGNGATVALVAGGLFTAAGVSLVLIARSGKKGAPNGVVEPAQTRVWIGPAGIGLRGTW